jgi:hypothetical protein
MIRTLWFVLSALFLSSCETTPVTPIESGIISIQYVVNKTSHVNLYIENSYGTKVMTIVDKQQDYGTYSVQFTLAGLPEGIYFYFLSIDGTRTIQKKMIILSP